MKLAIGTTFDYQLPIAQQFAEISKTAFELVSLGADTIHSGYLDKHQRPRLPILSQKYKIGIDSLHVPFTSGYDLSISNPESRMAAVCRVAMCIAAAVELDCNTVILHLNGENPRGYGQDIDSLLSSMDALIESGENMNIKLAAENLPGQRALDFLTRCLDEYDSDNFGFCYDSSHDMLGPSEPYQILDKYGDRLFALHLSDNDGKSDCHWIPFTGVVDWKRVCEILRQHRYNHPLLLEVENRDKQDTPEFLQQASDAACKLREMIGG